MLLVLLLAAAAVVAGAVAAGLGRAGVMTRFRGDFASLDLTGVTPADVALLHPPMSAWGYNVVATEEALQAIARAVSERDRQIAALQTELTALRARGGGLPGPIHDD